MTPPVKFFDEKCMKEESILLLWHIFPADNIHEHTGMFHFTYWKGADIWGIRKEKAIYF